MAGAAALASLSSWPLSLVLCGTAWSGGVCVLGALRALPDAICEIELQADYALRWRCRRSGWHTGRVAGEGHASAWLILLRIVPSSGRGHWLMLAPDSAPPEALWELRLRLRNRPPGSPATHNHTAG